MTAPFKSRYLVEGDEATVTTFADLAVANADDPEGLLLVGALRPGETAVFGGGAAAEMRVTCLSVGSVPAPGEAIRALARIYDILDGSVWDAETFDAIVDVLRDAGFPPTDDPSDDNGDDACPECERSNGPHFSGPCVHGGRR